MKEIVHSKTGTIMFIQKKMLFNKNNLKMNSRLNDVFKTAI